MSHERLWLHIGRAQAVLSYLIARRIASLSVTEAQQERTRILEQIDGLAENPDLLGVQEVVARGVELPEDLLEEDARAFGDGFRGQLNDIVALIDRRLLG